MRKRGGRERRSAPRGGSAVEFVLLSVFWVPLLTGVLVIGTAMIRAIEAVQVARDAGHMYARGVDFALEGNQRLLARLGEDMGLKVTGGEGVVILSKISYIGPFQCKAEQLADNSDPPNPTGECKNYQHYVFVQRVVVGDSGLRSSRFGAPDPSLLQAGGRVSSSDRVRKEGARVSNFDLLPAPPVDGSGGFQAGQYAYLVEAAFKAPKLPGLPGDGTVYVHAIF